MAFAVYSHSVPEAIFASPELVKASGTIGA
jgi:hypothetical protein